MKRTDPLDLALCADVLCELIAELDAHPVAKAFFRSSRDRYPRLANLHDAALVAIGGASLLRVVCLQPRCETVSFAASLATFRCPRCRCNVGASST